MRPLLAGELLVQAEAGVALVDVAQLGAEDHVVGGARRVQVHDVGEARRRGRCCAACS